MKNFEQSRRDFLRIAGKGVMGAAALSAIPSVMTPALAEGTEAPAWPWTWQKLDKQSVLERTYKAFPQVGGCCAAVVAGILDELAENYGYPYNQINARMFANGGGGYGRQTLCGSLGGACAVLGLFCESKRSGALRNELYTWYENHEFPGYQPEIPSVFTVSNSIQCSDSVGKWMQASGCEFGSPERIARCAGVSAEVAVKVVELLNIEYGFEAAPVVEEPAAEEPKLADNEYIGEAQGFGGTVRVKVTMDGAKIVRIDVLEHAETPGLSDAAIDLVPKAIVEAQSTDIDSVAGVTASITQKAIFEAVKDALSKID